MILVVLRSNLRYLSPSSQTLTTVRVFFLAMTTFPGVQARAQSELDAVLGPENRLPTPADRMRLPYVDAVLKECLRWRPILPLALPHMSAAEDVYRGWRIPAGTVVLANSWYADSTLLFPRLGELTILCAGRTISRDSSVYADPEHFIPERFLTPDGRPNADVLDPRAFAFGYGRR